MQTIAIPSTEILADLPYVPAGGSQHLCLVRHSGSQHLPSPYLFDWQNLNRSVLASAFIKNAQVVLPILLPPPHDRLVLPPLTLSQLKPQIAKGKDGRVMGMLLTVPGLYSRSNQVLLNTLNGNTRYDYRREVAGMQEEAQRLMASTLRRGIMRVRERPGFMGHAVSFSELAPDEVCISRAFAERLYPKVHERLPDMVKHVWQMDGLPVWATRFPVGNEFGLQEKYLRVVEGGGRFVGVNPWCLGKLFLGDNDGDLGFGWVRCDDLLDGKVERVKRPRVVIQHQIKKVANGSLTLQSVLDSSLFQMEPKAGKMEQPEMRSVEERLAFIQDCDARCFVAVLTIVLLWWAPRVLATKGGLGAQEAYLRCARMAEWFLEGAFDSRKEGSPFMHPDFDMYAFLNLLMVGESERRRLDFEMLLRIGVPADAVETLQMAWIAAEGNLRKACAESPVYEALVLRRRQMNDSVGDMLGELLKQGKTPNEIYQTVIDDLTCRQTLYQEPKARRSEPEDYDLDGEG